ncbi:hypothetical protein KCP75_21085 [Salmonella enterica subsp. enterica]|nr:hypothetical protein KCP75_21085 [Salmonella enterica subsp. enterica]
MRPLRVQNIRRHHQIQLALLQELVCGSKVTPDVKSFLPAAALARKEVFQRRGQPAEYSYDIQ